MSKNHIFSIERIRQLVRYDPETGVLYWMQRHQRDFACNDSSRVRVANGWNARYAGKPISNRMSDGRVVVDINLERRFRTQGARVAWAIHHGYWPEGLVDHIDGDCSNDRIENLREVSASENNRNQRISKRNTSGKVGVTFFKRTGKWRAWINVDGKTHSLGYFADLDEAIAARIDAENRHGFFEATRRSELALKYEQEFQ